MPEEDNQDSETTANVVRKVVFTDEAERRIKQAPDEMHHKYRSSLTRKVFVAFAVLIGILLVVILWLLKFAPKLAHLLEQLEVGGIGQL